MEEQNKSQFFKVKGEELVKKVKELIAEGNARKIIIKDTDGKPYLEIPLTVGVVGAVFAPVLAAVGALAALVGNFTIEIVRKDDKTKDSTEEK
jgi:hypothetical protein